VDKLFSNVILDEYNNLACADNGDQTCSKGIDVWEKFENTFPPIIPIIVWQLTITTLHSFINKYLETTLARKLADNLNTTKLSDQSAYAMSSDKKLEFVIRNIGADGYEFSKSLSLIASSTSALQNACMVLNDLIRLSKYISIGPISVPDLALYSLTYGLSTNIITHWLGSYKAAWSKERAILNTELKAVRSHDDKNIATITKRGGEKYALDQQQGLIYQMRPIEDRITHMGEVQKLWQDTHAYMYNIGKFYLFGWQIFTRSILYEHRWTIHETLNDLKPAFLWAENNNDLVMGITATAERIKLFLDASDKIKGSISTLTRIEVASSSSLSLKGVTLNAGQGQILKPSDCTFEMGKRYLITGDSGNGKSTILSKIIGLKDSGGITSSGEISISVGKKIRFLTQDDFFPHGKTLREALYYPDSPPNSVEDSNGFITKAVHLLNEMKFNEKTSEGITDLLDEGVDLNVRLSGGQKKKVQLVAEILKKPDILMLDESLNGMDQSSKEIALDIIKRELPTSMVLIIDHNGANDLDFYNEVVDFREKGLSKSPSRSSSLTLESPRNSNLSRARVSFPNGVGSGNNSPRQREDLWNHNLLGIDGSPVPFGPPASARNI